MLDPLLDLYDKNLAYARRLVADVPAERWAEQPAEAVNHPAWVLGHLTITSDRVAGKMLLGLDAQVPDKWSELFGPSSTPGSDVKQYPPGEELTTALRGIHGHIAGALRELDADKLNAPPASEKFAERFPTLAHGLTHVLIAHENLHLGQLSAWRRTLGFPAVSLG